MIEIFNLLFNIKKEYRCIESQVDSNILDGLGFVIQKENFGSVF